MDTAKLRKGQRPVEQAQVAQEVTEKTWRHLHEIRVPKEVHENGRHERPEPTTPHISLRLLQISLGYSLER